MAVVSMKNKLRRGNLLVGNEAFIPGDYESIATVTMTSGSSSSITFSNIPTTYTHLQMRITVVSTNNDPLNIRGRVGNGSVDTGSNYAFHGMAGDSNNITTYAVTSTTFARWVGFSQGTSNSAYPYTQIIDFLDYKNTSKYKTMRGIGGGDANGTAGSGEAAIVSNLWMSTSAINTIGIYTYFGGTAVNFGTGSTIALYGIKGS
jgi:hypothetical protein